MPSVGTGGGQIFSDIGLHKGIVISIKHIKKDHMQVTRGVLLEFNQVAALRPHTFIDLIDWLTDWLSHWFIDWLIYSFIRLLRKKGSKMHKTADKHENIYVKNYVQDLTKLDHTEPVMSTKLLSYGSTSCLENIFWIPLFSNLYVVLKTILSLVFNF